MHYGTALAALLAVRACLAVDPGSIMRADAVKAAFKHAWEGYVRCAGGKDTLEPLRCAGTNDRGGWGVTNIDAISTALVMNLTDIANSQILSAVKVDFSKIGPGEENEGLVNSFETTIRYLGGLLSVHDLLLNGYGTQIGSVETKAQQLLIQAKTLGDTLGPSWKTLSGFPGKFLNLSTDPAEIYHGPEVGDFNSAASIGGHQLEYARLSNLTALPAYVDRSIIAARKLFTPNPDNGIALSFPGLVGSKYNINSGEMVSDVGGWIGSVGSYYEQLLKLYIYDPSVYPDFLAQFKLVTTSTRKKLASHPTTFPNITYVASHVGKQPVYSMEYMGCIAGANLLQAGKYLSDPDLTTFGKEVIAGCRFVALHTAQHLAPEEWIWLDANDPVPSVEPTDAQTAYIAKHGYWAPQDGEYYYLRPEYLESLFYAYRITKNPVYREWAWEAFTAINATCFTANGYVGTRDTTVSGPRNDAGVIDAGLDVMESFFLSETLKFAYLIFQDDTVLSLDDWVFTNEGHPIRIQARDQERKANADCFKYEWCINNGWH